MWERDKGRAGRLRAQALDTTQRKTHLSPPHPAPLHILTLALSLAHSPSHPRQIPARPPYTSANMEALMRATETIKAFRVRPKLPPIKLFRARRTHQLSFSLSLPSTLQETRLSALRGPAEFFDYNRISRPADLNQTTHVRNPLLVPLPPAVAHARICFAFAYALLAHILQHSLLLRYALCDPYHRAQQETDA